MICGKSVWLWLHRCCRWHGKEARRIAARWQKRRWTAGLLWKSSGRCALRRKGIIRSWSGPQSLYEKAAVYELAAPQNGWIRQMDAEACGRASMLLGAGRETKDSAIDPAAGIVLCRENRRSRPERGSVGPALHQPSGSLGTGTPDFVGKLCVRSGEAR